MTSPAFDRLSSGYYNPGLRSGANPGGLSGKGAVRANWEAMLADLAAVVAEGAMSADTALDAAASALGAPGTKATSTTNVALPGAVPADVALVVVEADRLFVKGQSVVASSDADPLKQVIGPIKAWNPATKALTIRALFVSGAGAVNDWNIGLSAPIDGTLTGRVTALETALTSLRSRRRLIRKELF